MSNIKSIYTFKIIIETNKKLTKKQLEKVALYHIDIINNSNQKIPKCIEGSNACIEWNDSQ
jgi:hypothetical protein